MRATSHALEQLRAFARYRTHAGYKWAAVMEDGELMCEPCVRGEYRQVFRATRGDAGANRDFKVIGLTHSGEHEGAAEHCAHCSRELFAATDDSGSAE